MNSLSYTSLREKIRLSQDNNFLQEGDEVSDVILTILLKNKNREGIIDTQDASTDMGYFIDQLQKAKKVLDAELQ